jgi:hypothetical protein
MVDTGNDVPRSYSRSNEEKRLVPTYKKKDLDARRSKVSPSFNVL